MDVSELEKKAVSSIVTRMAIALEEKGMAEYADKLRYWNYFRQIRALNQHIGKMVTVISSAWGLPSMSMLPESVEIDPGTFNESGIYVTHQGKLEAVLPCFAISLADLDEQGIKRGEHGLPFIGSSSIREVLGPSNNLIYFNPDIDVTFFGRYSTMGREELTEFRRKTFGGAEIRFQKGMLGV